MSLEPDFEMTPHAALGCYFFGAARLVLNDQELKLSFKKVLALMAYLALEGSTSRSKLVGLLWSDLDEDSARRNLRRELHRLKTKTSQLEGRCESVGDDLRLREPFSSDAQTFLDAVARDDPETALGLYKGVLLEGLELSGASGFHEWLEVKREFFGRQHKQAMLDFAERLEIRGEWRRALELHLKLLERDELQERQHREIMRLHYLLGEREAALEQFERFKVILSTELKLEPLPETLELARQIRAAQTLMPQAQTRVSSQALLLPRTAPLVGRTEAWARMEAVWNAGQLIFVSGEPGVGKTRLLLEFASSKGEFFLNAGRPGDSLAPYCTATRSITDILERGLRTEIPTWVRRELSRLVPELTSEPPPATGSPEERLRFFQAFAELLTLNVSTLVSDDLQFFDAASLELGFHALQRFSGMGKHVMLGFRRGELLAENESLIEQFTSSGQAVLIELEALDENAVLELVRGLSGADGATLFSRRLHRATGGNPFFALETIRSLFDTELLTLDSSGAWITPFDSDTSDYAELPIPPSVRDAVLRRVRGLGAPSQRLLEAASLTSDGFTLETLQGATALTEWEGLEGLETAIRARILEPFSEGYKFAHDLMRSSIAENLSLERQKLLHKKMAATLEKTASQPAYIADHLEKAGLKLEAVPWRVKAAMAAEKVYANLEALEQYQWALEDGAQDLVAFEIYAKRLSIFQLMDAPQRIPADLEALTRIAARSGSNELQHESQLIRIGFEREQGHFGNVLELTEGLLKQALSKDHFSRAFFQSGVALLWQGKLREADLHLLEALEKFDNPTVLKANTLMARCQIAVRVGDLYLAQKQAEQALEVFCDLHNPSGEAEAFQGLGLVASTDGDLEKAKNYFLKGLEITSQIGDMRFHRSLLMNLVMTHLSLQELAPAGQYLEELSQMPQESLSPQSKNQFHYYAGHHARLSAQLGAALDHFRIQIHLTDQAETPRSRVGSRLGLAGILKICGAFQAALRQLDDAWQITEDSGLIEDRLEIQLERIRCQTALKIDSPDLINLEQLVMGELPNDTEDSNLLRLVIAETQLAHGDETRALESLGNLDPLPQMRMAFLALRLLISSRTRRAGSGLIEQAQLELQNQTLSPLEALELRVALSQALETSGNLEQALEIRQTARTSLLEIAATLEEHPDLQKLFLEKNRDLLTP